MLDKFKNSSARSMGLQVHCCRFQMFVVLLFRNVSNGVLEQNGNYQSHGREKSKWKKIKNRNQIRWDTYTYLYSYFYYLIRTPVLFSLGFLLRFMIEDIYLDQNITPIFIQIGLRTVLDKSYFNLYEYRLYISPDRWNSILSDS